MSKIRYQTHNYADKSSTVFWKQQRKQFVVVKLADRSKLLGQRWRRHGHPVSYVYRC